MKNAAGLGGFLTVYQVLLGINLGRMVIQQNGYSCLVNRSLENVNLIQNSLKVAYLLRTAKADVVFTELARCCRSGSLLLAVYIYTQFAAFGLTRKHHMVPLVIRYSCFGAQYGFAINSDADMAFRIDTAPLNAVFVTDNGSLAVRGILGAHPE